MCGLQNSVVLNACRPLKGLPLTAFLRLKDRISACKRWPFVLPYVSFCCIGWRNALSANALRLTLKNVFFQTGSMFLSRHGYSGSVNVGFIRSLSAKYLT